MTTFTITDDNGNTATAETIGKAKRALAKIEKAASEERKARRESEVRARDMAYGNLGKLLVHARPESWGDRAEVYEAGSSGFGIYTNRGSAIALSGGPTIRLAGIAWPAITAIYVSPVGWVMAVRVPSTEADMPGHWRALGADGETFDSVEIPASVLALFPAPTVDEAAPAPATLGGAK